MQDAPKAVPDLLFDVSVSTKFTIAHRLLRGDGFSHVICCEGLSDKQFKVFFAHNGKGNARLGIITSKKTLPRAVDRNRIKRNIREVFRQHSIKLRKLDLVVLVRRAYSQEDGTQAGNLKMLFSRVEKIDA